MSFKKQDPDDDIPFDPLVEALSLTQIQKDVKKYQKLLDGTSTEHDIHEFLANHSYFFNTLIRLYGVSPLYSKIKLGSNFEVDFAYFDTSSYGPEWELVEIESPKQKLFKKNGDPTAALTHAIRQLEEWHSWIHENLDYARKLMPYIEYPMGYIFMGRRKDLTIEDAKRLKRLNFTYRKSVEIHTLDYFTSGAQSVINIVEKENQGDWPLAMKALSHSDLAAGLPRYAQTFLENWKSERKRSVFKEELLKERDSRQSRE